MKRITLVLFLLILMSMSSIGCLDSVSPISEENSTGNSLPASELTMDLGQLPSDTQVDAVILHLYTMAPSNQMVTVAPITQPWDETGVTWNSFNASYGAAALTFDSDILLDWKTIDITALTLDWMNGVRPNHGLIMLQDIAVVGRGVYSSKDADTNHPYVELHTTDDSGSHVEILPITADAFIWEETATSNFGLLSKLFSGRETETGLDKQLLMKFELPELSGDSCTRKARYWRRHAGGERPNGQPRPDEVTPLLPITLGDTGGATTIIVTDNETAATILHRRPEGMDPNGLTRLGAQLLAAKLNVSNGAADDEIAETIVAADAILAQLTWCEWDDLARPQKKEIRQLRKQLLKYNRGEIGPGICN